MRARALRIRPRRPARWPSVPRLAWLLVRDPAGYGRRPLPADHSWAFHRATSDSKQASEQYP